MAGHPTYHVNVIKLRACLHGGGRPQIGEVTCGGSPHLSCKRDQIKIRDYMVRWVTSTTWGPPPPCKQTLSKVQMLGSDFKEERERERERRKKTIRNKTTTITKNPNALVTRNVSVSYLHSLAHRRTTENAECHYKTQRVPRNSHINIHGK